MITIKETTDADFLADLNKEVQEHHHKMYPEIFRPYVKDEIAKAIKKMLGGREAKAFVAYEGDEPAGYALIFIHVSTRMHSNMREAPCRSTSLRCSKNSGEKA